MSDPDPNANDVASARQKALNILAQAPAIREGHQRALWQDLGTAADLEAQLDDREIWNWLTGEVPALKGATVPLSGLSIPGETARFVITAAAVLLAVLVRLAQHCIPRGVLGGLARDLLTAAPPRLAGQRLEATFLFQLDQVALYVAVREASQTGVDLGVEALHDLPAGQRLALRQFRSGVHLPPSPARRLDHPQPALARRLDSRVRAAAVADDDLEFAAQTSQRRRQIAHRRRFVERRDDDRDERVFSKRSLHYGMTTALRQPEITTEPHA